MIVLIRINSKQTMGNPPLGLLYVGNALKMAGYPVKVLHICEDDIHDYIDEIIRLNPLWVGFSVNTGWSMTAALEMSRKIKECSSIPIVWGNAHPSLMPEQCLLEKAIDYVVIGEGEITSVELTDAIVKNMGFESIKGIGYRDAKNRIVVNPEREMIKDLDQYRMDWTLVDVEKYVFAVPEFGMQRAFQFITSRGCPHNCAFCYNLKFNRRKWRAHSEAFVVNEVLALKKSLQLDGIRFWDDNFFTQRTRAFNILKQIDLPYTTEIRVDYINESFAKALSETKCRMVLLGFESGSPRILKLIRKGTHPEQKLSALKILNQYKKISLHPSFIVGFPTESETEYKETLKLFATMIRTRPNFWFVRLGIYIPYPGSDLYNLAIQQGYDAPKGIEEWDKLIWDTSKEKSKTCVEWLGGKGDLAKDEVYLNLLHQMTKSRFPYGLLAYLVYLRIINRYYKYEVELSLFNRITGLTQALRSAGQKIGWWSNRLVMSLAIILTQQDGEALLTPSYTLCEYLGCLS